MWTKTYKVVGFLEPGVVRFGDKNLTIYISEKAIERYSYRLKGKPVTVGHIEGITEANAQQYSVGDVAVCTEPGECVVTIKNEEADRKIESGERFSCCWVPVRWGPGGTWHNIPYDKELVEMDFTHLAIVPDPRYENVEVFMNSKEYNNRLFDQLPNDPNKVKRNIDKYNLDPGVRHSADRYGDAVRTARQKVKVSNFQNSLNPGQYAFLKKYVKEYNNAKVDEGLSPGAKHAVRRERAFGQPTSRVNANINQKQLLKPKTIEGKKAIYNLSGYDNEVYNNAKVDEGLSPERKRAARLDRQATWTESGVHHAINYKANAGKNFMLRLSNPQAYRKVYENEAQPPDNSSERMDRINKYLQKREDRRIDKQYQTHEAPKQYNPDAKRFYNSNYRRKDGKEFNNNAFKEALKRWKSNGGESRIDSTRSLLTEQTGNMPHISKGAKGAIGRISESKAQRLAQDL